MGVYQGNDFRKISGGRRRPHRKNRKYELGRFPTLTMVDVREKRVKVRVRGGNLKVKVRRATYANVMDPSTGKSRKVKVLKVLETGANREYARRNIIVKGALIETEVGVAKVTSRPGQDGVINAVLVEAKETSEA
ncbi:MAG: 30S ribosomal protein S8e [Desulfurococcales archaeon]|nr:30S ribosomal protein S8e [Desulfurococcales archaeon]